MDGTRFDNFSRVLAGRASRRAALAGAAGGVLAALGVRPGAGAGAQVSQARCGNVRCASDPGRCNDGCVCCVYGNGNSRCRPPGQCAGGSVVCPPARPIVDPVLGRCVGCVADVDCGAGSICCDGACRAGTRDDPTNCGCGGERCPLNETCQAGVCRCRGSSSEAPATCCPGGGAIVGVCEISNGGEGPAIVADTCESTVGCPAGYAACIGPDSTGGPVETCRACCPPGSTCDPLGFCRL